ncbi:C39 family peptidase [Patescibacteria group bacterium]
MHTLRRNRNKQKLATYIVFAAIGIAIGAAIIGYPKIAGYIQRIQIEKENDEVMAEILQNQVLETTVQNIEDIVNGEEEQEVVILENAYLEVPFVCQAPFQTEANWVHHEESCEEAALLQVIYYLDGITETDKQVAHDTILEMIAWQEVHFGEHKDLYANDMKMFIRDYYSIDEDRIEIIYDADILDIKKAISGGDPVIVPIMGDVLHNPYYPHPGYHMLTVIGYTPEKIITNDVGTRRGEDFSYDYDIFMNATNAAGGDIILIKKN